MRVCLCNVYMANIPIEYCDICVCVFARICVLRK